MNSREFYTGVYNPDVLYCLANLSNDEVFTPPQIANQMLDLLPQELFSNPETKFLDPCCKSGVFLREIAKRLLIGLQNVYPDLQKRIDHIFQNQLHGIAITEMTSLLTRRGVYCSKYPNSKFSVTQFDSADGNIRYKRILHSFEGKEGEEKCKHCGASKKEYGRSIDLESHAYGFIHNIYQKEFKNMKFDVIIGNPPYQMSFGLEGANSANAKSIYNLFIDKSIKLKPRYLCMIVPSRWMTKTAQGIPDSWVDEMLVSNKFEIIHDFPDSSDCFPGVDVKGGVNYFLWNRAYNGKCEYIFHNPKSDKLEKRIDYLNPNGAGVVVRDPRSFSIIDKIVKFETASIDDETASIDDETTSLDDETTTSDDKIAYFANEETCFSDLVSPKHFFDNSKLLTSNWKGYSDVETETQNIKYYISSSFNKVPFAWISLDQIPKNQEVRDFHKVLIPAAAGSGTDSQVLGFPIYSEPNSVSSETYLVIGYKKEHNLNEEQCQNIMTYI